MSDIDYELLAAAYLSNYDQVINVIMNGADINIKNENGITPLMYASKNGSLDIVSELVYLGADLDIRNDNGETALIIAVQNGHVKIATNLINANANIYLVDNDGKNAETYFNQFFDKVNKLNVDNDIVMTQYNPFSNTNIITKSDVT